VNPYVSLHQNAREKTGEKAREKDTDGDTEKDTENSEIPNLREISTKMWG
jgi:hypothetical protein